MAWRRGHSLIRGSGVKDSTPDAVVTIRAGVRPRGWLLRGGYMGLSGLVRAICGAVDGIGHHETGHPEGECGHSGGLKTGPWGDSNVQSAGRQENRVTTLKRNVQCGTKDTGDTLLCLP